MFYDKFKQLCDVKGTTPTRAVEEMGLSRTIAVKWKKTGAVPRGKTLKIIADYFGVSESYLLSDDENQLNSESEKTLAELQVLKDDKDFLVLMDAYKKMTPQQVRVMKSFAKSLTEENNAD